MLLLSRCKLFQKIICYLQKFVTYKDYIKLSEDREIVSWKSITGCVQLKNSPLVDPPRWRLLTHTVLKCSRTLLLRSRFVVANSRYLCREAFQRKRHLPLAGFHLSVICMIIPHGRVSIINRYMSGNFSRDACKSCKLDTQESGD